MSTSQRTIAVAFVSFFDLAGNLHFPAPGDDVNLLLAEEVRLESAGALLPVSRPQVGRPSANRPGVGDMINLARIEVERGRPDRARRVLDAEMLEPRAARPAVVEEVRRLLGISGTQASLPEQVVRVNPWETLSYARERDRVPDRA